MYFKGMFPYMMIGVMPVFSADDWPKRVVFKIKAYFSEEKANSEKIKRNTESIEIIGKTYKKTVKERVTLLLVVLYLTIQILVPHSHWMTKGYNTWTNGLYGYSWDMMVHNWRHIHTRVTVVDKSMRKFYLKPEVCKTFSIISSVLNSKFKLREN